MKKFRNALGPFGSTAILAGWDRTPLANLKESMDMIMPPRMKTKY